VNFLNRYWTTSSSNGIRRISGTSVPAVQLKLPSLVFTTLSGYSYEARRRGFPRWCASSACRLSKLRIRTLRLWGERGLVLASSGSEVHHRMTSPGPIGDRQGSGRARPSLEPSTTLAPCVGKGKSSLPICSEQSRLGLGARRPYSFWSTLSMQLWPTNPYVVSLIIILLLIEIKSKIIRTELCKPLYHNAKERL